MTTMLAIRDLRVTYPGPAGPVCAVDGVSFELAPGAALGLVGASGSGKSQTALALLGLNGGGASVTGSIVFEGVELRGAGEASWRRVRGARIGMVFQDPGTSLDPYLTVGAQMAEVLQVQRGLSRRAALAEASRWLDAVQLGESRRRLTQYPHELSGGQRQRVMIASCLACRPALLVADEPTTALDATVQAQLLDLLARLRRELSMGLLLVSHDLEVVAELCGEVVLMAAGRVVDAGAMAAVLARHPAEG